MSAASQSITKTENPFATALGICVIVFALLASVFLHVVGMSLTGAVLFLSASLLLWAAFRYPIPALGTVLAFMPLYPLAIILARFFGPNFLMSDAVKASDRILLLVPTCIIGLRNRIRLKAPDWFLLACFGLALMRLGFGGSLLPLLNDFNFLIPYAAGRVALLTASQEKSWATRSVWIVAVLSVLGMIEVFIIGDGPRTVLYVSAAEGATEGGALNAVFHAEGFTGLRESATMFGPLQFASLCMVALIVWWVYHRNPLPGIAIAAGLICTVTRSAWLGTCLAIPSLAVLMHQKKRFLVYAALGLALFIASIPTLGLSDYLFATRTGQDPSAQGHLTDVVNGAEYVWDHPFGFGPGNAGMYAFKNNTHAIFIESTYLTLAAEYGIATSLCFGGFLVSTLLIIWPQRTQLGYAALGILIGFGAVMFFAAMHDVFSLACWVWFPVGLAVRSSDSASGNVAA
jgi:hypothetical protein